MDEKHENTVDENKHEKTVTPGLSIASTSPASASARASATQIPHRRHLTLKNAIKVASAPSVYTPSTSTRASATQVPHRRHLTLKNAIKIASASARTPASSASSASPASSASSASKPSNITYNVQLSGDIIKVQGKIAHRIKVVPDKDNRYNITFLTKPIVIISTDSKTYSLNNNSTVFLTKKGILEKINEIKNNLLNYSISQSDMYTTGMISRDDMTKFKALTETETIRKRTRFKYNILSIFGVNNYTFTNKNGKYTHIAIINYIITVDTYLQQLYNLIATNYDENNLLFDNFNKLYTELTKSIDQLAKLLEYKLSGVIDNTGKALNESSKINDNTIERIIYTALSHSLSKMNDNKIQIQKSIYKTNELGIYRETIGETK